MRKIECVLLMDNEGAHSACESDHVGDVVQPCDLVEADGQVTQGAEAGEHLQFGQTAAMQVQHLVG